jgi:predicted RNA-binding protein YlqC (UPF0109 family)
VITTGGDPTAILELVEPMATARGDHPDHRRVHGMTGASSLGIARRVVKEALGKVIGKHGRTITAMRMILHATRAQQDTRHALEVLDEARPLMGRQL